MNERNERNERKEFSRVICALVLALVGLVVGSGCGGGAEGGGAPADDAGQAPRYDAGQRMDAGARAAEDAGARPAEDAGEAQDAYAVVPADASFTDAATDAGSSSACGAPCGAGFTCGPSHYCVSSTGVPAFGHVYVMIFENKSRTQVAGSSYAPYLNMLMTSYATATNYLGVTHPSLPNYIAMTSGDTWGISCDCHPTGSSMCTPLTCNVISSNCNCRGAHANIGDQLEAASIEWRQYGEGMGSPCGTADSGSRHYAAKHVPFLYYNSIYTDAARCMNRVRDYADFAADLAAGTYRFSYITPDLCNDMHDSCGGNDVMHGDAWAAANAVPILATPGFSAGGTDVLFVIWDEADLTSGALPIAIVSPLVRPGATTAVRYDHYSMLATWEDGLGVSRLGMAASATPIHDIWR